MSVRKINHSLDDSDDLSQYNKLDLQQRMPCLHLSSSQPGWGWGGIRHNDDKGIRDLYQLFLSYSLSPNLVKKSSYSSSSLSFFLFHSIWFFLSITFDLHSDHLMLSPHSPNFLCSSTHNILQTSPYFSPCAPSLSSLEMILEGRMAGDSELHFSSCRHLATNLHHDADKGSGAILEFLLPTALSQHPAWYLAGTQSLFLG